MISYDDLVVALTAWRARQGLSVVQAPGSPVRTPAPASPVRVAPPATRTAPPSAPPRGPSRALDEDFDDGALVEDAPYDAVGDDYVMEGVEQSGESTAISGAPEPADVLVAKRKRQDW